MARKSKKTSSVDNDVQAETTVSSDQDKGRDFGPATDEPLNMAPSAPEPQDLLSDTVLMDKLESAIVAPAAFPEIKFDSASPVLDPSHLPPPPPRRPAFTHNRNDSTDTQLSQFSPAALPAIPDSPVQPWTAVPVTAVSRAAAVTESPLPSPDEEDILLELPLAPHERTRPVSDNATMTSPAPALPPPLPARTHSHSHVFLGLDGGEYIRAGTEMAGVVVMYLNEAVPEADCLTLHLLGTETTCWLEEAGGGAYTRCEENHVFCDRAVGIARFRPQVSDLSDPHNDDFSGLQLLSGSYSFPFKINVPDTLPRSFQYDASSIKYVLKAALETKEGTPLLLSSKPVFIMETIPTDLPAPQVEESKRFLFAGDEPMTVKLVLDKAVYYPGEDMRVHLHINNPTAKTVGRITTTVLQTVQLIAGDRSHDFSRVLCRASAEQAFVDARTPYAERVVTVRLPSPIAASLTKAQNTQCYVFVETEVAVSPLATGFKLRVPVVIAEEERHCKLLQSTPARPRVLPTRSVSAAVSNAISSAPLDEVPIK